LELGFAISWVAKWHSPQCRRSAHTKSFSTKSANSGHLATTNSRLPLYSWGVVSLRPGGGAIALSVTATSGKMRYPSCNSQNPEDANFCSAGTSLPRRCPACGAPNRPTGKFCNEVVLLLARRRSSGWRTRPEDHNQRASHSSRYRCRTSVRSGGRTQDGDGPFCGHHGFDGT
jgi:hypothetical protein